MFYKNFIFASIYQTQSNFITNEGYFVSSVLDRKSFLKYSNDKFKINFKDLVTSMKLKN
jgi:hypothetical protein